MNPPQSSETAGDSESRAIKNNETYDDPLDDFFGSGPASDGAETNGHADMSLDARRLQAQHNTVGYREGITAGKALTIQAGFDEGFALGAHIGIKAGQILGLLEGISSALAESTRASDLLSQAAADLSPASLFTAEFWAPDGTWTYAVTASRADGKVVSEDVADQHPLISKWRRIADQEAEKWDVDLVLPIFTSDESPALQDAAVPSASSSRSEISSRTPIEW